MLHSIKQLYRFLHPKYQNIFLDYHVKFKPRYGFGKPKHKQLLEIINAQRDAYRRVLDTALKFKNYFHSIQSSENESNPLLPSWNNNFLPGLDIIGIYTIFYLIKPKHYVEVGSGNSTKVARKAIIDHKLTTKITSIDPNPRTEIDALADVIIRLPFEDIDPIEILQLEEDDILFIDNSHRILPNSDAMVFFMEVLPQLQKGVIVHLHDIYLPYDYPQFMCNRAYNEQYGLAFYLLANPQKYIPIFPAFFISEDLELASTLEPIWDHFNLQNVEKHGGSFWLRIA